MSAEDTATKPDTEIEDVILSEDEDDETKKLNTEPTESTPPPPPPKDVASNTSSNENPYDEEALQEEAQDGHRADHSLNEPPAPPPKARIAGQKFVLSETNTEVYVTQSPTPNAAKLVILLTNSLGLASENNLALADTYSRKLGVPVIVPDMFEGDPIPTHGATIDDRAAPSDSSSSMLDVFKLRAAGAVKGFLDEMWMAKHTFERVAPRLTATVAEIAQVYKPKSIAVIGYSFGGKYVLHLLEDRNSDEWSSDEDLIACGASIAPSLLVGDDFNNVAKPLFFVAPDRDEMIPDEVLETGVSKLQQRGVTFERTMFGEGESEPLPHGFAVPGDYDHQVVGDTPDRVIDIVSQWIASQF